MPPAKEPAREDPPVPPKPEGGAYLDPSPLLMNAFYGVIDDVTAEIRRLSEELGASPSSRRSPREPLSWKVRPASDPAIPAEGIDPAASSWPAAVPPAEPVPSAPALPEPPPEPARPAQARPEPAPPQPPQGPAGPSWPVLATEGAGVSSSAPPATEPPVAEPPDPGEWAGVSPEDLASQVPEDLFRDGPDAAPERTAGDEPEEGLLSSAPDGPLPEVSDEGDLGAGVQPPPEPSAPEPAVPEPAALDPVVGSAPAGAALSGRGLASGTQSDLDAEMAQVESLIQAQMEKPTAPPPAPEAPGAKPAGEGAAPPPAAAPAVPRRVLNPLVLLDQWAIAAGMGELKPFLGFVGLGFLGAAAVAGLTFWAYLKW